MDPVFSVVTLLLLVGAAILWRRTNRISALFQLIACSVFFVAVWLEQLAQLLFIVGGHTQLLEVLRNSRVQIVQLIALLISGFVFPIGYIWYAITAKRI